MSNKENSKSKKLSAREMKKVKGGMAKIDRAAIKDESMAQVSQSGLDASLARTVAAPIAPSAAPKLPH